MQNPRSDNGHSSRERQGAVAIIGMACVFPGAPDVQTYWQNIVSKFDAINDPPEDWEADLFYEPGSQANDRIYCKRGGYLGEVARFDPLKYGVMPSSVDGGEPDHFLALKVATDALADSGYLQRPFDGERAEVILGRGTYVNRGVTNLVQHGLVVEQTLRIIRQLHPEYTEDRIGEIKESLKASLPPFNGETAPSLVPNIVTGRIANRLNLMGTNYIVDAACASSLVAVQHAVRDLLAGTCDMAIAGGIHASTPPLILMIFCQINALSKRGQLRPFDKDADGTLLGEGAGMVVLKRLEDAERDGDRIYAVIRGIGTASDGRALGLLAPRVEGEALAIERAYRIAGLPPRTVGLIEAHGTGTPLGDLTEIQALTRVFGPRDGDSQWCAVGSVKSMISHCIPASGIASLIKGALSLYHKVLPPTLYCDEPNPKLELEKTPFYINTETRPWIHGATDAPRRAGINAFGFGGINAHAVVEEYSKANEDESVNYHTSWETEVFILEGASRRELVQECEQLRAALNAQARVDLKDLAHTLNSRVEGSSYRLAVVASSLDDLVRKLDHALKRLSDSGCARIREPKGIYFFEEALGPQGKLAFLFPGEGSQYVNMLSDLCLHFPEVRKSFDLMDRAFVDGPTGGLLASEVIFPPPLSLREAAGDAPDERRSLWQMEWAGRALFAANQALFNLLTKLEIRPHAILGHSTGEYSALLAAGALLAPDEQSMLRLIRGVDEVYKPFAEEDRIPKATLLTIGGGDRRLLGELIERSGGGVHITMDNCPHQLVLSGPDELMRHASKALTATGAICSILPFNRAYHTPQFESVCEPLLAFLEGQPFSAPQLDLYSCTTAGRYPETPDAVRALAAIQWARPVRFRETVERMYEDGVRIFVEVGPRGNLTGFVGDCLRGKPHLAVASNLEQRSGITQLNHLVAMLMAHQVPMRLEHLYERRAPRPVSLDSPSGQESKSVRPGGKVSLVLPMLRVGGGGNGNSEKSPRKSAQKPASQAMGPAQEREAPQAEDAVLAPAAPDAAKEMAVASALPRHEAHHSPDQKAEVMDEYFRTMEKFLESQSEIMRAFMSGRAASAPATQAVRAQAVAPGSPSSTVSSSTWPAPAPPSSSFEHAARPAGSGPELTETAPAAKSSAHARAESSRVAQEGEPPAEEGAAIQDQDLMTLLLALVADRTGYTVEVLNPDLNMESELGIDSIKRTEILGAFQRQTGIELPADQVESAQRLKSLREIAAFFEARRPARVASSDNHSTQSAGGPLIGEILSLVPGREALAIRRIDTAEDLFLKDHTLGSKVSHLDPELLALPVIPLTISMEMLAEAGSLLAPGKRLVGMKNVRAYSWIALDEGAVTLQVLARRKSDAGPFEIEVQMRAVEPACVRAIQQGMPLIEGTMLFQDSYPQPAPATIPAPRNERPSRWTPDNLYGGFMFHGPSFQAVASIDRTGDDGTQATLRALPCEGLFRSRPEPEFLSDAVILDAAGQVIAYWTGEHLKTSFHIFPYRLDELKLYAPPLSAGERARCLASIELMGETQVRSDIEIVDGRGRLLMQLKGWEDRRFDLPRSLQLSMVSPLDSFLSRSLAHDAGPHSSPQSATCVLLDELKSDLLEAHGMIWQRVLAHLILGRRERERWRSLKGSQKRRIEWLLGRAAAKDAVRLLLRNRYQMELHPADIEIDSDEHGRPLVLENSWTGQLSNVPLVSISHSGEAAAGIAVLPEESCLGVGIDIEPVGRWREELAGYAFTAEEVDLLSAIDEASREEWSMRLWCAKEATAKSLGRGITGDPRGVVMREIDARTGTLKLSLAGSLAQQFPEAAGKFFAARTRREGDLVLATAIRERS